MCSFNRRVCGSMTDAKRSEIHLRMTPLPCSCPPPSSPLGAAGSAVTPAYRPPSCPFTPSPPHHHPLLLPTGDGREEVGQPGKVGCGCLTSHYSGLVSCHYSSSASVLGFTACSPSARPVHLSPARGAPPYSPPILRAVLWPRFKLLHLDGTAKSCSERFFFFFFFLPFMMQNLLFQHISALGW